MQIFSRSEYLPNRRNKEMRSLRTWMISLGTCILVSTWVCSLTTWMFFFSKWWFSNFFENENHLETITRTHSLFYQSYYLFIRSYHLHQHPPRAQKRPHQQQPHQKQEPLHQEVLTAYFRGNLWGLLSLRTEGMDNMRLTYFLDVLSQPPPGKWCEIQGGWLRQNTQKIL